MRSLQALIGLAWLASALPASAVDVDIQMDTNLAGCVDYASGIGACNATGVGTVVVTWRLDPAPQDLGIYDLEVRWDTSELTLLSADQLHPDSNPNPDPFVLPPSDPNGSRVIGTTLLPSSTTDLFRMTFAVSPAPQDGLADLEWDVGQLGGIGPAALVLQNPNGAGIDFMELSLPVGPAVRVLLALALLATGVGWARSVAIRGTRSPAGP